MDTLELAVLIYFGLSLKMALIAGLTIVYKMRLLPSRGTAGTKLEGTKKKGSGRKAKAGKRPVKKTPPARAIEKQAVASAVKPSTPEQPAKVVQTPVQETPKLMPSEMGPKGTRTEGVSSSTQVKASERIERNEGTKQVQTMKTAPVRSSEPAASLKERPGSRPVTPSAPGGQYNTAEQKSGPRAPREVPANTQGGGQKKKVYVITTTSRNKESGEVGASQVRKLAQAKPPAPLDTVINVKENSPSQGAILNKSQDQSAIILPKVGDKPIGEPQAGPTISEVKSEPSGTFEPSMAATGKGETMDTGSSAESNKTGSEQPAEATDSSKVEQDTEKTEKSGLGDLADLFAQSASDFTEKGKLAEQVKEVEIDSILQEGLGLLGKVKKPEK